jgi:hypothetical protein
MTNLSCKKQKGQVIAYALIITPILFLSLLLVYNVGTLIRQKISLQNTADATTYSAGIIYARNLNFLSYTNRAMAANEAGIASLASAQTMSTMSILTLANLQTTKALEDLMSADENIRKCAGNPPAVPPNIPACGRVLRDFRQARGNRERATSIANATDKSQYVYRIMQDFLRTLNYGVSAAQLAVNGINIAQIYPTVTDVMKVNDADAYLPKIEAGLGVGAFMAKCLVFTKVYWDKFDKDPDPTAPKQTKLEYKDEVLRFGHSAMSSMDLFTKRRQLLPEVLDPRYWGKLRGMPIDWAGGTELVAENKGDTREYMHWQSADRLNVLPAYQMFLGDASEVTFPGDHAENQLDAYNADTFLWGIGAGTASGGDSDVNLDSWKGNKLALPTALKGKSRTYGDIRKFNGSLDDISPETREFFYTDPARGNNFKDFINAAFYRSIIGKDRELFDDVDGRHPLAFLHSMTVGGLRYRYGNTEKVGILTNNMPMAPFGDVSNHEQTIAYKYDNEVEDNLFSTDPRKMLAGMNLSDIGPSLVLSMRKDISKIGYKKYNLADKKYESEDGNGTGLLNNRISVISSAEVYFKRPQDNWARKDSPKAGEGAPIVGFTGGYIEHKNLFSPYWHVRNSQPFLVTKLAILALDIKP